MGSRVGWKPGAGPEEEEASSLLFLFLLDSSLLLDIESWTRGDILCRPRHKLELVLVAVGRWAAPLGDNEKHETSEAFKIMAKTANMYMALLMLRCPMLSVLSFFASPFSPSPSLCGTQ